MILKNEQQKTTKSKQHKTRAKKRKERKCFDEEKRTNKKCVRFYSVNLNNSGKNSTKPYGS